MYISADQAMTRRERIENPAGQYPVMQQPGLGDGYSIIPSWNNVTAAYSNIPWYVYIGGPAAVAAYAAARGIQPGSSVSDVIKNAATGAATTGQIQSAANDCIAANQRIRAQGGTVAVDADAQCQKAAMAGAGGVTAEDVIKNTIIPSVSNAAMWIVGGLAVLAIGYYFVVSSASSVIRR